MNSLPTIVVLSNDAGASEYLAYLILGEFDKANWIIYTLDDSPASKIFKRLGLKQNILKQVEDFQYIERCDLIIYGTGWQVEFGKYVQKVVDKYRISSVALIDHWVNYKERFRDGIFPKYILTMDKTAFDLAESIFENEDIEILLLKNYFLQDTKRKFNSITKKTPDSVLFISEPTSTIAKKNLGSTDAYGFTEYSVLSDILEEFDSVIIRLHPSDNFNKYDDTLKRHINKNICIVNPYEETLVDTLSKSNLTIGFDGMAIFISYILGVKTVSYMPNSKRKLTIPIPKKYLINSLKELNFIDFNNKTTDVLIDENSIEFSELLQKILKVERCIR